MKKMYLSIIFCFTFSLIFSQTSNKSKIKTDKLVKINSIIVDEQEWMTENLNVDRFLNGDIIPEAKTNAEWLKAGQEAKPAWCFYNNDIKNKKKYGRLYNWWAVIDSRKLISDGWFIPSDHDYEVLSNNAKKLSIRLLSSEDANTTNDGNNFSTQLSGYRLSDGEFGGLDYSSYFWTFSISNVLLCWNLDKVSGLTSNTNSDYSNGKSIRCVRYPNKNLSDVISKRYGDYFNLGTFHAAMHNYKDAILNFDLVLKSKALLNNNNNFLANVYLQRGTANFQISSFKEALSDFSKIIEIDSTQAYAFINRAAVKNALKDISGSIIDLNRAIKLNPKSERAFYNRGIAKKQLLDSIGACNDMHIASDLGFTLAQEYIKKHCSK